MSAELHILWRGSLESCNYGCPYCPFAKTQDDKAALARDRAALERFENWVSRRQKPTSILFTPWGEALIRGYYRQALTRLSHLEHVTSVAIQTNFSCSTDWVAACDLSRIAFWITYHPGEVSRATFLSKIEALETLGARYSVGVVGLRDQIDEIEALKRALPDTTYLWVNAYRKAPHRYSKRDIARLTAVDPLFSLNNRSYGSHGRGCAAGETSISVGPDGRAQRCHFIKAPIGNIYDADFEDRLKPRLCTAKACHCHIGYSQLKDLGLAQLYGNGFAERRARPDLTEADALNRLKAFSAARPL